MAKSLVYDESLADAVRIVNLYKYLSEQKRETVMSKQLLRSGTSIGANVSEALNAESDSDFIHKLAIAQKEVNETAYWLSLLVKTEFLTTQEYQSMSSDTDELRTSTKRKRYECNRHNDTPQRNVLIRRILRSNGRTCRRSRSRAERYRDGLAPFHKGTLLVFCQTYADLVVRYGFLAGNHPFPDDMF